MKKIKQAGIFAAVLLLIGGTIAGYVVSGDWTIRFKSELNDFFGEGNWECIDAETKESIIYSEYITVRSNPALSGEAPGKFRNWYILFENQAGEEEIWSITNHTLKINHDEYGFLSTKRYSNRQAFTLELMDISFGVIGEDIWNRFIRSELSEGEAACIEVTMSYNGGNPAPEFYDAIAKESWFNVGDVAAEHYLTYELHDFYIYIRAHDYRLEKLTAQEQQNVLNSLGRIERNLLNEFGDAASFEIYLDKTHKAEYVDGKKQAAEQ